METFEGLLEWSAQLIEKGGLTSENGITAARGRLDHAQKCIRRRIDLERVIGVEFTPEVIMLTDIPMMVLDQSIYA